MDYDLGYIDLEEKTPSRQPFWPKSVTYVVGRLCNLRVRAGPLPNGGGGGI